MQDILINWAPQETRVAVVENGAVQELHLERELERGRVGNIYIGKVARVLPGMQSAFVEIGLERAAFLHIADVHVNGGTSRGDHTPGAVPPPPIERIVFEGQTLTVQVIKDPIGTKGARLSTQISIAGRLLVFLPQDDHIGISQKIGSHELREQLRARMTALVEADAEARARAGDETRRRLHPAHQRRRSERRRARRRHRLPANDLGAGQGARLQVAARNAAAPGPEPGRARAARPGRRAHADDPDRFADAVRRARPGSAASTRRARSTSSSTTPASGRSSTCSRSTRRSRRRCCKRVDLKSGGYLIIDQTEALTTVDVNTGGFVGARNFDDTIFKTNLEAGQAIARQLRLRNLGGIIIIDFIDMAREEHQAAVLAELKKQLARDRTRITVSGFTQLGLVEMTRKRTRESLAHMLCEPCPTCQGRGEVKTARSVCHDILREILREARQFNPKEFRILASAAVVEMLLDEESQHLAGLSDFIGKPISLRAEPFPSPEQYDIVLL